MKAQEKIDEYIDKTDDWRGELIQSFRALIHDVEPEVEEEWKWNSPVWSYKGNLCSAGAFKKHVSFTFFNGASLEDDGLFNSGTGSKNNRSLKLSKGDKLDLEATKRLIENAVDFNKS